MRILSRELVQSVVEKLIRLTEAPETDAAYRHLAVLSAFETPRFKHNPERNLWTLYVLHMRVLIYV